MKKRTRKTSHKKSSSPQNTRGNRLSAKPKSADSAPISSFLGELSRQEIDTVVIPQDLDDVSLRFSRLRLVRLEDDLLDPAAYFTDRDGGCDSHAEHMLEKYGSAGHELSEAAVEIIQDAILSAFRAGFYLAVMRYSEELKNVPEAVAILNQQAQAARKGADARRQQAAPKHKQIRKRFRELRKTSPKKGVRYLRLANEFDLSARQIARIVEGID